MAERQVHCDIQFQPDEWRMLSDGWWIQEGDCITAQR